MTILLCYKRAKHAVGNRTFTDWLKWYEIWMDNPLVNIDAEAIERTITEMHKTMVKSARIFVDIPAVQNAALQIKEEIEAFKPYIPLIQGLRNPGMRLRHWEDLKDKTGKRHELLDLEKYLTRSDFFTQVCRLRSAVL